jgi:tRNA pseudouridine55 synthase
MITTNAYSVPSILPVWQPIGYSTYQITNLIARKYRQKATHTGVLDPLAEGVIIVLLGDERYQKLDHSGWLKEYEFEITYGLATDSFDGMGVAIKTDFTKKVEQSYLENVLKSFVGPYSQKVPLYSAKKVGGQRLFMYPKLGMQPPELPIKTGRIHAIDLQEFSESTIHTKVKDAVEKVKSIKQGDFRQQEILNAWSAFLASTQDTIVETAKVRVVMTRGLYVRSLCQDIAHKTDKPAFVSSLVRTKNGRFSKTDCASLESLFGTTHNSDLLKSKGNLRFLSRT